ncbi:MAG: biotin transporter BioY [Brucellaceae bacterium]|nr:biotin transporter BioY [Brucellaceae bacterium]
MTLFDTMTLRRAGGGAVTDTVTVFAASLLLVLSAKIAVPFYPVPMTMQTLVVIGIGLALGPVRGGAAILLYLAEGAAGLPVFAGTPEKGIGLAYMAGPTGGYLIGFVLAAVTAGLLARRGWDRSPIKATIAALLAGAVIYLPGLLWLGAVIGFDKPLLEFGLYPFIAGDLFKAVLAGLIFTIAWRALGREGGR